MRIWVTYFFILNCIGLQGQVNTDTLQKYSQLMHHAAVLEERLSAGAKFETLLDDLLEMQDGFTFQSTSVKLLSVLHSPDKVFRVFTWNIPLDSGRYEFKGRILMRSPYRIMKLKDVSQNIQKPESKTLKNGEWFGATYYQISGPIERKGKTYTLLGWNGHNAYSNKKLIETLQINEKGEFLMGVPALFDGKRYQCRRIFEYAENVNMSLKFQEKGRRIIFDHLAPPQPAMEGVYAFYGPDFTYDAYRLKKGKWVFEKDVDARNEGDNKGHLPKAPERGLSAPAKKKQ